MYERAAGDKTLPSDLRPPIVLRRTLDYLFHDLLPRTGLAKTAAFIRDRSRAVRNDFTMQHETGPIAMECHDRCVRFHMLAMHLERNRPGFSCDLEEQQLMNSLQSLKEFYEDQRCRYESPNELEMRVYHRLIHIRDQKERHEEIPEHILNHPAFRLTTKFRLHVQARSSPITKKSALIVDADGMAIFSELAGVLVDMGNKVMCYLVACILERRFGEGTVDDIESIRGDLSLEDIIDGVSSHTVDERIVSEVDPMLAAPSSLKPSQSRWLNANVAAAPTTSDVFGAASQGQGSVFGRASEGARSTPVFSGGFSSVPAGPNSFMTGFSASTTSAFSNVTPSPSPWDPSGSSSATQPTSAFGIVQPKSAFGVVSGTPKSVFGGPTFTTATSKPPSPVSSHTFATSSVFGTDAPTAPALNLPVFGADTTGVLPADPSSSSGPFSRLDRPRGFTMTQPPSSAGAAFTPDNAKLTLGATVPKISMLNPKAPAFAPFSSMPMNGAAKTTRQGDVTSSSVPPLSREPHSDTLGLPGAFPLEEGPKLAAPTQPSSLLASSSVITEAASTESSARAGPVPTPASLPKIITSPIDTLTAPCPSPSEPPPLDKQRVVPLPPTSSIASATSPFSGSQPPSALLQKLSSGTLSPLLLATPTTSRPLKSVSSIVLEPPNILPEPPSLAKSSPDKGGRVKLTDLEDRFVESCRRGWLVKKHFRHWLGQAIERAEWEEACRQSDIYKQKMQLQRSATGAPSEKKRQMELSPTPESPIRKRARKRVSSIYQPPRTDEQLAQRLKENQEENQRRWARGSFLVALRDHVREANTSLPFSDWRAWLSTNPENDNTAIWLERKFDVPVSGEWVSESVFSIALFKDRHPPPSPGIIVFECTPLRSVSDEIERKYRILDDCSRMRDIVRGLPSERPFVPSLLCLSWSEDERLEANSEMMDMVIKLEHQGILASYHSLSLTSDPASLDNKFREALALLKLDVTGSLAEVLPLRGVLKLFQTTWDDFVADCVDLTSDEYQLDRSLLGMILDAAIRLLNDFGELISRLLGIPFEAFTSLNAESIVDSEAAFDTVIEWLSSSATGITAPVRDIESHRMMGNEFPLETFLTGAYSLVVHRIKLEGGDLDTKVALLKADIASTGKQFRDKHTAFLCDLRHTHTLRRLRSERLHTPSTESVATAQARGLDLQRKKRVGMETSRSPSNAIDTGSPMVDSRGSPTPSVMSMSTTAEEKPIITVAMLRELTRSVKGRYSL